MFTEFLGLLRRAVLAACLVVVSASAAPATTIGGGGSARIDCLAVFETAFDVIPPRRLIRCVDGDSSCDADGQVNGACVFSIGVCANSSFDDRCTLRGVSSIFVEHSADNGDPEFDPDFQALQSRIDGQIDPPTAVENECTTASNITVPVKGPFAGNRCRSNRKTLRMTTVSQAIGGRLHEDRDSLRLVCRPAEAGCDPLVFFDGTFDRIQTQIFDQSCALSACHDSESQQAGLLLEVGASHAQLINVTPTNAGADAAGWKRVTVLDTDTGDPDASFLFHKVTGDLPAGFGGRMPLGRPALPADLIEIIRLWIEAGAPETGWVPGTDQ